MGLSKDHFFTSHLYLYGSWNRKNKKKKFENILGCDSRDNILSIHEKNQTSKSNATVPLMLFDVRYVHNCSRTYSYTIKLYSLYRMWKRGGERYPFLPSPFVDHKMIVIWWPWASFFGPCHRKGKYRTSGKAIFVVWIQSSILWTSL